MKKIVFFLVFFLIYNTYSQENKNGREPIIFGEIIFGGTNEINGNNGFLIGGEIKYQLKNNLFSFRYLENSQLQSDVLYVFPFIAFPIVKEKKNTREIGILYGKRWGYKSSSISISGGISLNTSLEKIKSQNNVYHKMKDTFLGIPFEFNFKWFQSKKKKYRLYGIIPIGRPTSFGRSFGFKILGNISKNSFIGFGFVYGLGVHKKYFQ